MLSHSKNVVHFQTVFVYFGFQKLQRTTQGCNKQRQHFSKQFSKFVSEAMKTYPMIELELEIEIDRQKQVFRNTHKVGFIGLKLRIKEREIDLSVASILFQHTLDKFKFVLEFIGGSLESPQWLPLAFCPRIMGSGGDLQIVNLLEKECSFSGADNVRGWGHSHTIRW